jgi:glycosyltransferase involved in cell wall biosynthesis
VIPNQERVTPQSAIRGSLTFQSEKSSNAQGGREFPLQSAADVIEIALLTGGDDKPYVLGLATALTSHRVLLDFIGSDELNVPELVNNSRLKFLNLRGDQRPEAGRMAKVLRVLNYYLRLIRYAATAKPKVFHILWNNKFEFFDRTLLMLYYEFLGKNIVLTAHNVNISKRDSNDSWLNRLSLKIQYRLSDHIFVHTERMKNELVTEFGVLKGKVSVIPFGINNTVPNTEMTTVEAKRTLGIGIRDKTMLCFGRIAPYKGLEYLIAAFTEVLERDRSYQLIIAGRPKWSESDVYWRRLQQTITENGIRDRIIERIEYIPDEQTELYFKAADVLVLPYTRIFQSGVLFLGYSFGLPVIAADVGSLREEIIESKTGFVFRSRDSSELARTIGKYFESELFRNLENQRTEIRNYANERYSWNKVGDMTKRVYAGLLWGDSARERRLIG